MNTGSHNIFRVPPPPFPTLPELRPPRSPPFFYATEPPPEAIRDYPSIKWAFFAPPMAISSFPPPQPHEMRSSALDFTLCFFNTFSLFYLLPGMKWSRLHSPLPPFFLLLPPCVWYTELSFPLVIRLLLFLDLIPPPFRTRRNSRCVPPRPLFFPRICPQNMDAAALTHPPRTFNITLLPPPFPPSPFSETERL